MSGRRAAAIVCDTHSNARTNIEVQWIIGDYAKAAYRFPGDTVHDCDMANLDYEIDPIKVRSGLLVLITARLEDSHVFAVKSQFRDLDAAGAKDCITNIRSIFDEL